jgi:hypothetical protein
LDALAIEANIRARHMPFGTLLDPINASSTSDQIAGYTRCGDSALWTGTYLAAESFHYAVTKTAAALQSVSIALGGLEGLLDITEQSPGALHGAGELSVCGGHRE